jgi:two-component system sensor histidine kinase/response regulator
MQLEGFLVKPVTKSMIVDTLVNVFAEGDDAVVAAEDGDRPDRLRGVRILLTEDNEINQQIARELLEGAGASVDIANNGREAVERVSAGEAYDIVLMDLQMPEMDGFQATAKLRSDDRFAALPIVAMTAHATTEERLRCLAAGMNDHIAKPIDPEQLIATVARFRDSAGVNAGGGSPEPAPAREARRAATDADLPDVEGLDVRDGLARVAGNRKLYRSLLRQFVDQQGTAIARAAEALTAGDVTTAERAVHSLRGVAANIGAAGVQAVAARLEGLIRERATEATIADARRAAGEALAALVSRLTSALGPDAADAEPPSAPSPVDPALTRDAAARLAALLSDFDPGAYAFVESHGAALRPLFDDAGWRRFRALVDGYEFGDAQHALSDAIKDLQNR